MKDEVIYYSVGALLYTPANNKKIVEDLKSEKFGKKFSLAFCLEDTIAEDMVSEAEDILIQTINNLYDAFTEMDFYLPKIFIRVREPKQITSLVERLGEASFIITGFNAPKVDTNNIHSYIRAIKSVNTSEPDHKFWLMPIFESDKMVNPTTRQTFLCTMKLLIDTIEEYILNIRVGGNDLCHAFGLRRHTDETIYDIKVVSDILTDVFAVFGRDYVVSGPVWEYYNGENWQEGLKNEIKKDMLNGFVGKTAAHPNQISVINNSFKVSSEDYEDAYAVINWDKGDNLVSGSVKKSRMNEYNTHINWANRILHLADYYGIDED